MKIRLLTILAGGMLASGCLSLDSTKVVATPWAAAGLHSFAPERASARDDMKTAEAIAGISLRDFSLEDYELDEPVESSLVTANAMSDAPVGE